jgi:hypothetical protein
MPDEVQVAPTEVLRATIAELEEKLAELGDDAETAAMIEEEIREAERQLAELEAAEPEREQVPPEESITVAQASEYAPAPSELVAPLDDQAGTYVVLDRHDEELIIAEFQKRALKVMLYDFPMDGTTAIDLSYGGVLEAVRLLNQFGRQSIGIVKDTLSFEFEEHDGEVYVVGTVAASNGATGMIVYGTSTEPQRLKLKKATAEKRRREDKRPLPAADDTVFDPFARTKAASKAQRNALKGHIPEAMRQTMIAMYRGDSQALRTIKAGVGAESLAELPPALASPEAEELRKDIEEAYLELRELSRTAIYPQVYNAQLQRAAHSLEMLRGLLASIRNVTIEERRRQEAEA